MTDGSATRRTNTAILSFALSRPPQHIRAGYIGLRLPMELYIPNPLRCYKCQKYGDGSNTCRGSVVCVRCGATDHNDCGCNCEAKCVNCRKLLEKERIVLSEIRLRTTGRHLSIGLLNFRKASVNLAGNGRVRRRPLTAAYLRLETWGVLTKFYVCLN